MCQMSKLMKILTEEYIFVTYNAVSNFCLCRKLLFSQFKYEIWCIKPCDGWCAPHPEWCRYALLPLRIKHIDPIWSTVGLKAIGIVALVSLIFKINLHKIEEKTSKTTMRMMLAIYIDVFSIYVV